MKKFLMLLLISLIIGSIILSFNIRNNYLFVEVDNETRQIYINYLNKQVSNSQYKSTKQEMRALLEDELDFHDYTYKEVTISNGGYADMRDRVININKDLSIEQYTTALCHEMCHLKYNNINEIYTQFMTFKTLYESDNEELKMAGTWFGIYILDREYEKSYDCSALIVEYLVDNAVL